METKRLLTSLLLAASAVLAAGDTAPSFAGPDQNGKRVKLADFADKKDAPPFFVG